MIKDSEKFHYYIESMDTNNEDSIKVHIRKEKSVFRSVCMGFKKELILVYHLLIRALFSLEWPMPISCFI